jgi:ribosomal-protein-alanine N-acetyltransferase
VRTADAEPSSIIRTPRLELRPCTREVAQAALTGRQQLERILGVRVAAGWPSQDLRDAIPVYVAQLDRDPNALGWGLWLLVDPVANLMLGDAGFKGRPDVGRRVEIGYGVAPAERGKGYATEAAIALLSWAREHGAYVVTAECLEDNVPSIRVLEKAGLQRRGQVGPMIRWEKRVQP